jgi:nicotinamidase-related amidase
MSTYELQLPDFFDPASIRANLFSDRLTLGAVQTAAEAWRKVEKIDPAGKTRSKITSVGIDYQNTFVHAEQELMVPNAAGDCERYGSFLLRNARVITDLVWTLDSHKKWHIFSTCFWLDSSGNHPNPFTAILPDEIRAGKWKVNPAAAWAILGDGNMLPWLTDYAIHYGETLAKKGLPPLVIWPDHAQLGTPGHALDPVLKVASDSIGIARRVEADFQVKGLEALSEMYSPFGHEVTVAHDGTEVGSESTETIRTILESDAAIFTGEASSHCVLRAMMDVLRVVKVDDPSLAAKIYFLEDCTSPVPTFETAASDAIATYKAAGINVVKSTTPIHEWPGVIASLVG